METEIKGSKSCSNCFWARKSHYYPIFCPYHLEESYECNSFIDEYSYSEQVKNLKEEKDTESLESKNVCSYLQCKPAQSYLTKIQDHNLFREKLLNEIKEYNPQNIEIKKEIEKGFRTADKIIKILESIAFKRGYKYIKFKLVIGVAIYIGFLVNALYITQFFICNLFNIRQQSLREHTSKKIDYILRSLDLEKKDISSLLEKRYPFWKKNPPLSFL